MRFRFAALTLAAFALLPAAANAATGFSTATVNLRAGPGTDYPRLTTIRANTRLQVYGCLDEYDWCDVSVPGARGFMSGRYVEVLDRRNRRGSVVSLGSVLGLSLRGFSFDSYWNDNYRNRSFYRDRNRYRDSYGPRGGRDFGRDNDRRDFDRRDDDRRDDNRRDDDRRDDNRRDDNRGDYRRGDNNRDGNSNRGPQGGAPIITTTAAPPVPGAPANPPAAPNTGAGNTGAGNTGAGNTGMPPRDRDGRNRGQTN